MEQLSLFEFYNCNKDGYSVTDGFTIDEQIKIMLDIMYTKISRDLGLPND